MRSFAGKRTEINSSRKNSWNSKELIKMVVSKAYACTDKNSPNEEELVMQKRWEQLKE